MKQKQNKKHKLIQLGISLLIIILLANIVSFVFFRLDLTSEKRYTLTEISKKTLRSLNDHVYIKIYLDGDELPLGFKRLRKALQEMLDEYKLYTNVELDYQFVNLDKIKDKNIAYRIRQQLYRKGLAPIELNETSEDGKKSKKTIFPGATIVHNGRETIVNFLKNEAVNTAEQNLNNSIQSLEYEFINAIAKLKKERKPKIAFTEGHGELKSAEIYDISITLSEYYDIERVRLDTTPTDLAKFEAIVVAKPQKAFSEAGKYVLDQYIMNGGKVLWLIDAVVSNMDSLLANNHTLAIAIDHKLTDQLFKYGARINPVLVEDLQCAPIGLAVAGQNGKPQIKLFPWHFFPLISNHTNHSITKYLNLVKTNFVSSIDTVGIPGELRKEILLKSSAYTKTSATPSRIDLSMIREIDEQAYNNAPVPIAVLIEGEFSSVFENRSLAKFTSNPAAHKNKSAFNKMIVVADGDIIRNDISPKGEPYPLGFDKYSQKTFRGNTEFILNAMNYLCEDGGLMSLRVRELQIRLLDKTKIKASKTKWQIINTLLPIVLVILFGLIFTGIRKRKFK